MAVRWADGTDGDVIAMDDTYFPVLEIGRAHV